MSQTEQTNAMDMQSMEIYSRIRSEFFYPLTEIAAIYDENRGIRLATVAIHVPFGSSRDELKVRITPDRSQLGVEYQWPNVLTDVSLLHKSWLEANDQAEKIKIYHPVLSGSKNFFRQFRQREREQHDNLLRFYESELHCGDYSA